MGEIRLILAGIPKGDADFTLDMDSVRIFGASPITSECALALLRSFGSEGRLRSGYVRLHRDRDRTNGDSDENAGPD